MLNIDEVKTIFKDTGCTLISKVYINTKTKLEYICNCGSNEINTITLESFKKGIRCKNCRTNRRNKTLNEKYGDNFKDITMSGVKEYIKNKKHSYIFVKRYFDDNNCTLLDQEYIDETKKLKYICVCGKEWTTTFKDFKNGKKCGNVQCYNKRRLQTILDKYNIDNITSVLVTNLYSTLYIAYDRHNIRSHIINKCVDNYYKNKYDLDKTINKYGLF